MKIGLSSASMPLITDLQRQIRVAKEVGFDGIELLITNSALSQLSEATASMNLDGILSLHEPFREGKGTIFDRMSFCSLKPFPEPWNYLDYFNVARSVRKEMVCHFNSSRFQELKSILQTSNTGQLTMLEFNTYQTLYPYMDPQDFLKIAEELGAYICFDIGYAAAVWDPVRAFRILFPRILEIHLYDFVIPMRHWYHKNKTIGDSNSILREFVNEIKKLGYNSRIILELLPEPFADHGYSIYELRKQLG